MVLFLGGGTFHISYIALQQHIIHMYIRVSKKCVATTITHVYSLIQTKCQGGNKYVLPITVKFDQSSRRFGRISFARLFKLTKRRIVILSLITIFIVVYERFKKCQKEYAYYETDNERNSACIGAPFAV